MPLRSILLVDDHEGNLAIARISLERVGQLAVTTARSGSEALACVDAALPDAILLDVAMPGMDGLEVLRALRAQPRTAGIPVVFLTACAQQHEVAELVAAGAAGVVTKPYEPLRLPDELRRLVARDRAVRALDLHGRGVASDPARIAAGKEPDDEPAPPASGSPARSAPVAGAAPRLRLLAIDDEPLSLAAIQRMLRRQHDVATATSAADALARLRAGERFDLILSDLAMPGLSGDALFEQLATELPDQATRFAIMTGGPTTSAAARFLTRMAGRVLWKPFDAATLLDFIAGVGHRR